MRSSMCFVLGQILASHASLNSSDERPVDIYLGGEAHNCDPMHIINRVHRRPQSNGECLPSLNVSRVVLSGPVR